MRSRVFPPIFAVQGVEKLFFMEGIQGAGGFIHQADIRIAEKDSGNADIFRDGGVKKISVLLQKKICTLE